MADYCCYLPVLDRAFAFGLAHKCDSGGVCAILLVGDLIPVAHLLDSEYDTIVTFVAGNPIPKIWRKGEERNPTYDKLAALAGQIRDLNPSSVVLSREEKDEVERAAHLAAVTALNLGASPSFIERARAAAEAERRGFILTRRLAFAGKI